MTDQTAQEIAGQIVREVAELRDRTSPDDWPEAMLVTAAELHDIALSALAAAVVPSTLTKDGAFISLDRQTYAPFCGRCGYRSEAFDALLAHVKRCSSALVPSLHEQEKTKSDTRQSSPCPVTATEECSSAQEAETARDEAIRERDVERSRYSFHADKFDDLVCALERRAASDWGHLRYEVIGTLSGASKLFRQYAAGQPSPSNWRRRAEAAESQLTDLRQERDEALWALRTYGQHRSRCAVLPREFHGRPGAPFGHTLPPASATCDCGLIAAIGAPR